MSTVDIVQKLWNLCNVLKDDGVTYHQYVTELTYLLFLKMALETGTEDQIPEGYRWADLEEKAAPDRLEFYKMALIYLGSHGSPLVKEIFANASSNTSSPAPRLVAFSLRCRRNNRPPGCPLNSPSICLVMVLSGTPRANSRSIYWIKSSSASSMVRRSPPKKRASTSKRIAGS